MAITEKGIFGRITEFARKITAVKRTETRLEWADRILTKGSTPKDIADFKRRIIANKTTLVGDGVTVPSISIPPPTKFQAIINSAPDYLFARDLETFAINFFMKKEKEGILCLLGGPKDPLRAKEKVQSST